MSMENVIQGSEYHTLAVYYSDALGDQSLVKESLYDAVYFVMLLDSLYPEIDILTPAWDAYNVNMNTTQIPNGILTAVRAVNQHVLTRGGVTSIDAYLAAQTPPDDKIPQGWATLSAAAGFIIDPSHIEP